MDLSAIINEPVNYHLLVSALLGALIGLERDLSGKDPSLRTFSLICLGSCVFTLMSRHMVTLAPGTDPGRIAAQIVSGIGFLGAGAIFRSQRGVSGITTATLMWITAAIGMAVGFDRIDMAISATVIAITVMYTLKYLHRLIAFIRRRRGDPVANGFE